VIVSNFYTKVRYTSIILSRYDVSAEAQLSACPHAVARVSQDQQHAIDKQYGNDLRLKKEFLKAFLSPSMQNICITSDKGKPCENTGRKATGLRFALGRNRVAGLPGVSQPPAWVSRTASTSHCFFWRK
jgi:hypothetical protein